ncbi:unnamed protein product [Rhizoctonia solani]|uniref:BTB domain-containing protein n=1 Tax=Rhizoctonia solani TaxID=456999 RepID=A0A8H3E5H3_9AGAM|nr:unnamed protein product [Rhizoctonia solani]
MNSPDIYSDVVISDISEPLDIGAAAGEPNSHIDNDAQHKEEKQESSSPHMLSDIPNVVDMGQSDIELRVNNTIFKTHKHFLVKFTRLGDMIQNTASKSTSSITLYRDERGVDDINNTFKVLYASAVEGPFNFDTPVLISALRISSAYGFDRMRDFAIQHLEKASLGAIQRIQLAREFGLLSWEDPAYKELSERENAITEEEAQVLGFAAFAKLAQAREEHKDKLKKEQEEKAKKEAEAKAKKEAEEKARKEAEVKAKKEAEEKAKKEAEAKAKKEAEEKAKKEAAEKAKKEADAKAKKEADEKAKKEGKK